MSPDPVLLPIAGRPTPREAQASRHVRAVLGLAAPVAMAIAAWGCGGSSRSGTPADAGCDDATSCVDAGSPDSPDGGPRAPEGAPCEIDDDCEEHLCLPLGEGGARVCERPCGDSGDCTGSDVCGPSAVGDPPVGFATLCWPGESPSDLGSPCNGPRECDARVCLGGQCTVVCNEDGDCLAGQRCLQAAPEPTLGATVPLCTYLPIDAPTIDRVPIFEGAVAAFDPQPLRAIGIAPDAVSVTFVARRRSALDVTLIFARVVGPAGGPVLSYADILAYRDQPLRWIATPLVETASIIVPNTTPDRLNFTGGRWALEAVAVGVDASVEGDVDVVLEAEVKRAPGGVVDQGSLDLDIYLVGVDLAADEAADSPVLAEGLVRSRELFASVGVTVDAVRFHDVDPEIAERLAIIDTFGGVDSELAELYRLGAGNAERSIDVYLVRSLENADSSLTLGIAGDIPGPPAHGTSTSGVAVAFDVAGSAEDFGKVLTHELGHYLGLYHVRERLDACPPDRGPTPEAPCAPFGGGDVLADTTQEIEESCPPPCDDARQYVMFWSLQRRDDRSAVLSDSQGFVIRRHALVR